MTSKTNHTPIDAEGQATIQELLQEKVRLAIKLTMIRIKRSTLPKDSRATRLSQWYFLTRVGDFNGRERRVPRTRKGLRSQIFARYHRRQVELDKRICEMFIQGLSTKKVGDLVEPLSGNHPSPSTVSRIVHTLEEELTRSHLINP